MRWRPAFWGGRWMPSISSSSCSWSTRWRFSFQVAQKRHRVDSYRHSGHAAPGRGRLRPARRPLWAPQAPHGQRGFLFRGRVALRFCSQLHRLSDPAHHLRHRHGRRMGRRRFSCHGKRAGQNGAASCPELCRADIPSDTCWQRWQRVSSCPPGDGAPCSGWEALPPCSRFIYASGCVNRKPGNSIGRRRSRAIVRTAGEHWRIFLYLVLLMTLMMFLSHGTQDLYPDFLKSARSFTPKWWLIW